MAFVYSLAVCTGISFYQALEANKGIAEYGRYFTAVFKDATRNLGGGLTMATAALVIGNYVEKNAPALLAKLPSMEDASAFASNAYMAFKANAAGALATIGEKAGPVFTAIKGFSATVWTGIRSYTAEAAAFFLGLTLPQVLTIFAVVAAATSVLILGALAYKNREDIKEFFTKLMTPAKPTVPVDPIIPANPNKPKNKSDTSSDTI